MCKFASKADVGYKRTSGYIIDLVDAAIEEFASRESHTSTRLQAQNNLGSSSSNSERHVQGMIEATPQQTGHGSKGPGLVPEYEEVD